MSKGQGIHLRRAGDLAVGLAVCGYLIAAAVGLPLFEDGSLYLFVVATEHAPVLPNLRLSAALPQLPAVVAFRLGADLPLGRAVFAAGYGAIALLSLVTCWWLLRRRAPALLLLVLPSYLGLQLNFSGVSELLTALYLTWPVLLAMLLLPDRRRVMALAVACGPLLLLLHPLGFVFCFGLGALAWLCARRDDARAPVLGQAWRRIALWLIASGLLRLGWTAVGLNDYERSRLEPGSALNYVLAESGAQHLLLLILSVGILAAAWLLHRQTAWGRAGRALLMLNWLALLTAIWVGVEFILGEGVVLKSALTVAVGLVGMAAVASILLRPAGKVGLAGERDAAAALRLNGAALLILLLAKSSAWWTGVHGLQDLVATSETACIRFAPEQPYSLQWPWMVVVDAWSTPFTALVTRPFVVMADGRGADGRGVQPVAVLLHKDGCARLQQTGEVHLPAEMHLPFARVDAVFGPLRAPAAGGIADGE